MASSASRDDVFALFSTDERFMTSLRRSDEPFVLRLCSTDVADEALLSDDVIDVSECDLGIALTSLASSILRRRDASCAGDATVLSGGLTKLPPSLFCDADELGRERAPQDSRVGRPEAEVVVVHALVDMRRLSSDA